MAPSFVITNFGNVVQTLGTARTMKAALTGHPDPLFNPLPHFLASLDDFGAGIDRLQVAYDGVQKRNLQLVPERNAAHIDLKKMMTKYVKYGDLVADGNIAILQSIGAPLRAVAGKSGFLLQVGTPQLAVVHAGRGGVYCKSKSVKGAFSYQIQFTDGDPGVEANWKDWSVPSAHASSILINGLTSGKEYSFRMRAIGSTQPGPWSAPVTIMIL